MLSFDVSTFMVLHHLRPTGDQKKVKSDLTTVASWFSAMAQLIGSLYRRYPMLEIRGLLSHLVNALHKKSPHELFVLQVCAVVFCAGCRDVHHALWAACSVVCGCCG